MEKPNIKSCPDIYNRYIELINDPDLNKNEIDSLVKEAKKCGCSNVEENKTPKQRVSEAMREFARRMAELNAQQKNIKPLQA